MSTDVSSQQLELMAQITQQVPAVRPIRSEQFFVNPENVGIYQRGYRARLTSALEQNYPLLVDFLGQSAWQTICQGYISRYPARHRSIRFYGSNLSDYIAFYLRDDLISEYADFEWVMRLSADAPNEECIDLAYWRQLNALDWPNLQFSLAKHCFIRHYVHDVVSWWQQRASSKSANVQYTTVMLWRYQENIHHRMLTSMQRQCVLGLKYGLPLSLICARLFASSASGIAEFVAKELAYWVQAHCIVSITTK